MYLVKDEDGFLEVLEDPPEDDSVTVISLPYAPYCTPVCACVDICISEHLALTSIQTRIPSPCYLTQPSSGFPVRRREGPMSGRGHGSPGCA